MNEEKFQVIPSDTEDNEDMMQNQNKDNDPSAILIIITIQMLSGVVPIGSVYYAQHESKQSSIDAPLLPLHHHGNLLKCHPPQHQMMKSDQSKQMGCKAQQQPCENLPPATCTKYAMQSLPRKAIAQSRQMLSTNVGILTTALNTKGEGIDKCENDHRNEHQVWDCIDKCEIYASPSKDHCITRHHPQQQVCKQSRVTIHRPLYTMAVRMMTILLTIHHVSILSVNRVLNQNHFQVKIHLKKREF
eukprot:778402_1